MIKVLENIKAAKKALIVTDVNNENIRRSASNIPGVKTTAVGSLNVYDIVNHTSLIVTKDAGVVSAYRPFIISESLMSLLIRSR